MKTLTALSGPKHNAQTVRVILDNFSADEKLTPKMAARAAKVAFGHRNGVTVWDWVAGIGYRLYSKSARKLSVEQ